MIPSGNVILETITSDALRGNPLGDPFVRRVPVYLPPGYESGSARYPTAYVLTGFTGRGTMLLNDSAWGETIAQRMDRLIAAAERGVRVRLLLDDWNQTAEMDRWLALMEIYPSIEVRIFNPFGTQRATLVSRVFKMAFGPQRLRGRMHNKAHSQRGTTVLCKLRMNKDEAEALRWYMFSSGSPWTRSSARARR